MRTSEAVDPGVGFQAAVGITVGAVATGLASLALAVAGVSTGALLSTVPTIFTAGLVVGALAAWARPGVAVRLGARRWRSLEATLPAFAVGAGTAALYLLEAAPSRWLLVPAAVATVVGALFGWATAAIAHDAYVESITDDPVAEWAWKRAGADVTALGLGIATLAIGAALAAAVDGRSTVVVVVVVAIPFLLQGLGPLLPTDPNDTSFPTYYGMTTEIEVSDRAHHYLRAYDAGLVVDPAMKATSRKLVSWDRITDVRLTDDELVLERRWRPTIRCDRSVIDEPEEIEATLRASVASESSEKRAASA